ncbi:MAG TPA: 5-dehydro-2-deoxygluconokinase [Actinobacteria bacterium]|nr:5-dehydro-2-deoxygluconokinase [Actinomycetota bacterium]
MDVLSVGRVSVDLYAEQPHVGFDGQQTFTKSVGGSPTNVAVAAARLGRRAAIVTKVGDDGFGRYVRRRLQDWGVDTTYVGVHPDAQTPLALAALNPPETPEVAFYRGHAAPDTFLAFDAVPEQVIRDCRLLWMSQGSLAQGSTATTCLEWLSIRDRASHTVLDLDYRAALWPDRASARAMATRAIGLATVVVGNREECDVAVGTADPDAAANALIDAGVTLAIIKLGADGALLATAEERHRIAPTPIDIVCGLGAGDAFGGALCHGLLSGWDLPRIGRFANAAGALVSTRLTCADAMPSINELEQWVEGAA